MEIALSIRSPSKPRGPECGDAQELVHGPWRPVLRVE
jgi:hypothetical protein